MSREPIPQDVALRLQLAAITGNEPESSFIEIRPLHPPGRQWWIPVCELDSAAAVIGKLAADRTVYVSAAPRTRRSGDADAVARAWCLWADCDSPDAVDRLRAFRPLPSIVVRSGTPGRVHAWWALNRAIPGAWIKPACRRLARHLHADMKVAEPARVLRPAGTWNWKHNPARPVECIRLELDVFEMTDVIGGLPDDQESELSAPRTSVHVVDDRALEGLARKVRETPAGNRNSILFWAACRVREHADDGTVDPDTAAEALRQAARGAGLPEPEIDATLRSALNGRAAA